MENSQEIRISGRLIGLMLGCFVAGGAMFALGALYGSAFAAAPETLVVTPAPDSDAVALPAPTAIVDPPDADDDPALGPDDAPITIIEFSDFQCPYCARFHAQTLQPLLDQYGDQIRFVYRDLPLTSIHPDAQKAAEAAECAHEQGKFWELHDAMFTSQPVTGVGLDAIFPMAEDLDLDMEALRQCVESGKYADEIAKDMEEAALSGVTATPTFFINGIRLVGAQPLASFTAIIEQELNR